MGIFNKLKKVKTPQSKFDLSHERKLSFDFGELIPILCEEVVPNDRFQVRTESLLRLPPMIAPVMHRINCFTHYFFVPSRLLFTEWNDWLTGGSDGLQEPAFPQLELRDGTKYNFQEGKLADYFGLPVIDTANSVTGTKLINALPFRAYQMIYNEYYRDQTLTPPVDFSLEGGIIPSQDMGELMTLRKRCYEKDYFTSSLPNPQRGADVDIPVESEFQPQYVNEAAFLTASGGAGDMQTDSNSYITGGSNSQRGELINLAAPQMVDSTSVTINELRNAISLQQWLEKNARGGARIVEVILNHFGIRVPDYRLQRPEYLGGSRQPIVISEVLSTVQETSLPQGNQSGHGISVGNMPSFSSRFPEHGYLLGIMSVIPRTGYQQGIEKMWTKFDRHDLYWPSFANLGEQAIENDELYFDQSTGPNEDAFGYTPRHAEYKSRQSKVCGEFRSSLNFYHASRIFDSAPGLNTEFTEVSSDDLERLFAVQDGSDKLWCQLYNSVQASRPMPYYGTPGLSRV
jgi:hypothetical protein